MLGEFNPPAVCKSGWIITEKKHKVFIKRNMFAC